MHLHQHHVIDVSTNMSHMLDAWMTLLTMIHLMSVSGLIVYSRAAAADVAMIGHDPAVPSTEYNFAGEAEPVQN